MKNNECLLIFMMDSCFSAFRYYKKKALIKKVFRDPDAVVFAVSSVIILAHCLGTEFQISNLSEKRQKCHPSNPRLPSQIRFRY